MVPVLLPDTGSRIRGATSEFLYWPMSFHTLLYKRRVSRLQTHLEFTYRI